MLYSIGTATSITSVPIASSTSLDIVEAEDLLPPKIGAVVLLAVTEILSPIRLWRSAPILSVQIMVMKKRSDDTIYVVAVAVCSDFYLCCSCCGVALRCIALPFSWFLHRNLYYLIVLILSPTVDL